MPDTVRTLSALQTLLADGGDISAQDVRDFLVSVYGGWRHIETQEVSGSAAMIEFTSIPSTYDAIQVVVAARSAGNGTSGDDFWLRVGNGTIDSGASAYGWTVARVGSSGGNVSDGQDSEIVLGSIPSDSHDNGDFGSFIFTIPNYTSTSQVKNVVSQGGFALQDGSIYRVESCLGAWLNDTQAIDRLLLRAGATVSGTGDLEIGSNAMLYGLVTT